MSRFADPLWFLLVIPVVLRVALVVRDRSTGSGSFQFSSFDLLSPRRSLRTRLEWLPLVLETLAICLFIGAMARPQHVTTVVSENRYGIDMVVALDSSGSMAAEDFRPRNRFGVAKELIGRFIDSRVNDRLGIVTFGSRAATRVPITFDHDVARGILSNAQVGENGDGTAIGQAIATAVNRLRNSTSRSKVIILVTDGVNNAGSIEPATAADLARRYGIKIYTVGVGSKGNVPIPVKVQNRFTGEIETVYQMMRADLDEEMLSAIATRTGGAYFRAVDPNAMQSVLTKIDRLEKTQLSAPRIQTVRELYVLPLAAGLALLTFALTLGETIWLKLPA
ncbi:MAG: VWA domain-containing protein [Acidobacteriota bacterium]